nr:nucleoside diphosphate-linked moiety X motif 8 isoform X1 [Loxodonta africana]
MLRWVTGPLPLPPPPPPPWTPEPLTPTTLFHGPNDPRTSFLCLLSFPGGKCDSTDQDVVHTALRETLEEVGLAVPEQQVWGILHPVSDQQKATVVPVLASVGPLDPQSLRPNLEEVSMGTMGVRLSQWTVAAHPLSTHPLPPATRWMRCLRCPWPTCCRHRIRAIPTSASVVTSGTHCLSSCTGHTASGGSQLSSPSSPCSCWHQAPTSPDWLAFRCPGAEDLAPAAPTFAWPGWFHSRTE